MKTANDVKAAITLSLEPLDEVLDAMEADADPLTMWSAEAQEIIDYLWAAHEFLTNADALIRKVLE